MPLFSVVYQNTITRVIPMLFLFSLFVTLTGCSNLKSFMGTDRPNELTEIDPKCHAWNKTILELKGTAILEISRILDRNLGCIYWPVENELVEKYPNRFAFMEDQFETTLKTANSAANNELLWFRAQVAVSLFARYGYARMNDYLEDIGPESFRLIEAVIQAEKEIFEAVDSLDKDDYPLHRADSVFAIVNVAAAATSPTFRQTTNILKELYNPTSISSTLKSSEKILKNLFRTIIYLQAYQDSFVRTSRDVRNAQKLPDLTKSKDELAEGWHWALSDLETTCNAVKTRLADSHKPDILDNKACAFKNAETTEPKL